MATLRTIVIVGASLAGLRAAETLRHEGYDGTLVMLGDERHLPYDRPPLSKELLAGEWEPEQIALRKKPYDDLDLDLRLGRRATGLDVAARAIAIGVLANTATKLGITLVIGRGTFRPLAAAGLALMGAALGAGLWYWR